MKAPPPGSSLVRIKKESQGADHVNQRSLNQQLNAGPAPTLTRPSSSSPPNPPHRCPPPLFPACPAVCHNRLLLGCDAGLRASTLLALTKLMAVDPGFCEHNLQLLFTLLQNRRALGVGVEMWLRRVGALCAVQLETGSWLPACP